ncbi:MAG TPA: GNAT family N-acetyltransferase [Gemmatimonadales bacterium]|jgi:GNAT superfamily N-acetyltransferase
MSVTVYHLELTERSAFTPSRQAARYRLEQVTAPSADFLRFLYSATGSNWHWVDRAPWTDQRWLARQAEAGVEIWVAREGGAPLGYFELAWQEPSTVEIVYFGLLPHAVGTGQGGVLLGAAINRAWEMGASRVYVNTCTLDHPKALANYQGRGFRVFREELRS